MNTAEELKEIVEIVNSEAQVRGRAKVEIDGILVIASSRARRGFSDYDVILKDNNYSPGTARKHYVAVREGLESQGFECGEATKGAFTYKFRISW